MFGAVMFSEEKTQGIDGNQIFNFHHAYFIPGVTEESMEAFINKNVSIVVVQRKYADKKHFIYTVVGAITISAPIPECPAYITYFAVSDREEGLPSLYDENVHLYPPNTFSNSNMDAGYQGLGLGLLLLVLTDRVVWGALPIESDDPVFILHFKKGNFGSEQGWLKHGFRKLADPFILSE